MEEYQNLMQVKTALDMEIAVYKQLLETEEDRLGIKPENGLGRQNILCREVLKDIHVFCLKYVLSIHLKPWIHTIFSLFKGEGVLLVLHCVQKG